MEVKANKLYASKNFDPGFVWRSMRQRADIHHITGAINYVGLGLPSDRTLLTVHDVGHLTNTLKGIRQIAYEFLFWRA